jgi:hypothetical protein
MLFCANAFEISNIQEAQPEARRTFQVQNKRKPARCQATTVSGLTMASAERQSLQRRDSQTHNRRSVEVNLGRFFRGSLKHADLVAQSEVLEPEGST